MLYAPLTSPRALYTAQAQGRRPPPLLVKADQISPTRVRREEGGAGRVGRGRSEKERVGIMTESE